MRIYFATNRNPDNPANPSHFGNHVSTKGLTDLRFGWADVQDSDFSQYTLHVAAESLDVDLENAKKNDLSGQILGSNLVFEEARKEMRKEQQDCVIFIHGFNCDFRDAIQATAQIKQLYAQRPMTYFLFTWPSDGSALPFKAYISDRDDARVSGVALGRGLQKLAHFLRGTNDYCNQSIHLFAHSMGNYALRWALQEIKKSSGNTIRRLLDQIILFAADEDDDAFEYDYKLKFLPDMAKHVTLYHNPKDMALTISEFTKGNPDRLGASGPRNARLLPDKVSVVNCEAINGSEDDITGHQYYRLDPIVKQDVIAVLNGAPPHNISTRIYQPETRCYYLQPPKTQRKSTAKNKPTP